MDVEHWQKDADTKTGTLKKDCPSITLNSTNAM